MNAFAACEARESSLARLPEISARRVPRRGSDECWLETLEKVTEKIDKISVFGGLDAVLKDLVKIR